MADVQALGMDVVTEKSGHSVVGMAVSVCLTPAAPAPLPMPYPLTASASEGITDSPLRTKICGVNCATIGSVLKTCHGNEPGTLKEVVSLNQMGPVAPVTGAFTVLIELGPAAITGSLCDMNKAPTPGVGSNASDAGGTGGGGGSGAGGPGAGGSPGSPQGPSGGGGGAAGSADGAAGTSSAAAEEHTCQGGEPVDLATGAVVDKAIDLALPGLIPLVFKRYYSSLRHDDRESSLGPGWAHNFDQQVLVREKGIALRDGQGRFIRFEKIDVGQSSFHRRERMTLTRTGELEFRAYSHEERRTSIFAPVRPDGPATLRRIEDNYGNALVFEYRADRLARVVDTAGRTVNVAWRGGLIVSLSVASGTGFVVSYEYARNGCLAAVRDPLGNVQKYRYDTLRRLVVITRPPGTQFAYEYEGTSPRCVSSYGPDGLFEVHLKRDSEKRVTETDGEEPRVAVWNELGLVERLMLPDGTVLDEVAYDVDGLVIAHANGAGEGFQYWYDERGRRIREMDPCGQVTMYEHERDRLARVVGADGQVTRLGYDEKGSLATIEYPWGEAYFFSYDARGRLVEMTGKLGQVASYEYDVQNNVIAETDSRGARTTYRYDGLGRAVLRRDALGREARVTYDARGRRTSITHRDGTTTTFAYDAAGRLAKEVDALGRATGFSYSGLDALSRVTGSDGRIWRIEHTAEERVRKVINPLGEEYSFDRDLAGRVIAERTFDGRELIYERDAAGRVSRMSYPDATDRTFQYDRAGRIVRDATREDTRTYHRNVLGRILSAVLETPAGRHETRYERDLYGRLVAEIRDDQRIRSEVDGLGRRTRRVLPNGATTHYAYDAADAVVAVEHDGHKLDLERDLLGRELACSTPGGLRIASRYDQMDRLVERKAVAPGYDGSVPRTLSDRRWNYDRVGRPDKVDDARWGSTTYAYDTADRLLAALQDRRGEAFAYDGAGSIVEALEELDGSRREAKHELAPGNVLLRAGDTKYAYDKRGRRIRKVDLFRSDEPQVTEYLWDARDQLRSAALPDGSRITFTYDALGRRVRKEVAGVRSGRPHVTEYVWDANVLAMQIDSVEGTRVFVHAPWTFVPLLQQERGEVLTYVTDAVGTAKELLTADGAVAWSAAYRAWGDVFLEHRDEAVIARHGRQVRSPFRQLGHIADDELGLSFTRYRLFDSSIGRWVTPDPLGIEGGDNLYAFDGAPTTTVDPWGLAGTGASGSGHPSTDPNQRTPRAARREAMRQAGIPTSQQPTAQQSVQTPSGDPAGRQYTYTTPAPGGGSQTMSVQHSLTDDVPGHGPHWEAGPVKTDPNTGEVRDDSLGRPKLQNSKSKVDE